LALQLEIDNHQNKSDVVFAAEAFKKWSTDSFDKIEGDFAIAIWDKHKEKLVLGRDKMGVKTLYYSILENQLVFASEIKGILKAADYRFGIDEKHLVTHFSFLIPDLNDTLYNDIKSLPPAHYLVFETGKKKTYQYWEIGQNPPSIPTSTLEQEKEFNRLFEESVRKRIRTYHKIGAEVSGGLDSTGIAAVALDQLEKGTEFYSYSYSKSPNPTEKKFDKDDTHLVRELCKKHEVEQYFKITNEEDINAEEIINFSKTHIDEVDSNGVPSFTLSFLPSAKENGVGIMLSGWAGDQMVTNTCGGFSEALANKKNYKGLWKDVQNRHSGLKAVIVFISYIYKSWADPFYKKNKKISRESLASSGLSSQLKSKFKLAEFVNLRYYLKSQTNIKDYQKWNMFHFGILDRTVHHGLVGKHFNIDYRFPMLDVPLLEYIHQLPFSTLAPKGKTRYLFKKAMKGRVPYGVLEVHKSKVPTTPFAQSFYKENMDFLVKKIDEVASNGALKPFFNLKTLFFKNKRSAVLKYIQIFNKIIEQNEVFKK